MTTTAPDAPLPCSLDTFLRGTVPLLHRAVDSERLMDTLGRIVETDRWNTFERHAQTAAFLRQAYEDRGANATRHRIPTGGPPGSGRWIIQETWDVNDAYVDLLGAGETERLLHYQHNPWCVIQWSAATAPDGLRCPVRVIDSWEELDRLPPFALRGTAVLTKLSPYHNAHRWAAKGAAVLLCDAPVKDCPDATQWGKFGWAGLEIDQAAARPVGFMLSTNEGIRLRAKLQEQDTLTIHACLDARRATGHHEVVSALLPGQDDPQDELWVIAHGCEPGAIDNASGVAASLEIARVLSHLITAGQLPPLKRSVRFLHGQECYGFFDYLAQERRLQPPLAGICVDCVGARPELCEGQLKWHASVPSSAAVFEDVGAAALHAALEQSTAQYTLVRRPFTSTEDTMIADPAYGFPCPYLGHFPYRGYHSSADTIDTIDPDGLQACVVGTAAYLLFLANLDSGGVTELAQWHTRNTLAKIPQLPDAPPRHAFVKAQHNATITRLRRWLWGGDRDALLVQLTACSDRIDGHAEQQAPDAGQLVPFRRVPLAPTYENVDSRLRQCFRDSHVHKWALYWADGSRTLQRIRELASAEASTEYSLEQITAFFQAMAEIGYVKLVPLPALLTRDRIMHDLRALGLHAGMDVMVHSSLSSLGFVRGGPGTVVDALLETIGPDGTLMMPSFNHRSAQVFNPMATPTTDGAIPDTMWRRPDAVRSLHATHAVAAIGPKAHAWCQDHLTNGIWAPDSPIGRLVHQGGYVLGLGVDHNTSTAYHVAETSMPAPCLDAFGSRHRIVAPDGTVQTVPGLAWRNGPCPVPPAKLSKTLDARGLQTRGQVGKAACVLVKAIDLWDVRREHLSDVCPTCTVRPKADS